MLVPPPFQKIGAAAVAIIAGCSVATVCLAQSGPAVNGFSSVGSGAGQGEPRLADQTTPTPEEMEKLLEEQRIVPKTEALIKATDAFREHLKMMRALIVRFNIAPRGEDRKLREEFVMQVLKGHELHQTMMLASLEEYKLNNENRPKIADMLSRLVDRDVEADRYDGVLPFALQLFEDRYPNPELERLIAMTAVAMNEYDIAERFVDRMIDGTPATENYAKIKRDIPLLKSRWARELAARENDAAGEPLPRVEIVTTKGVIELELFENQAPETVANFIHLVEKGFYDGLVFFRVLEHFAAQAGCPEGDGSGDDGYTIFGETDKPGARDFFRGSIGMALSGEDKNSGGTQFFITFIPTPDLDETFTSFGRVIRGIEVLGNLTKLDPEASKEKKEQQQGLAPDEIIRATVLYKRDHEYVPNKAAIRGGGK